MKKIVVLLFITSLFVGVYKAHNFYNKNLTGVAPAIFPAPTTLLVPKTAINSTGLPLLLPNGFRIDTYASNLVTPRVLVFDPNGVLLVSSPAEGKIVSVPSNTVVIDGLNRPHGMAFRDKNLYIAETDMVAMYDYNGKATTKKKLFDLPGGGNHFSRTIGFGPDGNLYVSVGSSCNVCNEKDARRAKILVANADGSDLHDYATGLRNAVFFVWKDQDMWATEMGRDLIGDDIPPDEINIVKKDGFYGWPFCYGKQVYDTTQKQNPCASSVGSHIDLQAHSAPLGLAFIPPSWPEEYRDDLLVAFHGSWNRSTPTGYKVVRIKLDALGNYIGTDDFITGFLGDAQKSSGALGRPVDLLFDKEGNLFISDDKAGNVYKVSLIQR